MESPAAVRGEARAALGPRRPSAVPAQSSRGRALLGPRNKARSPHSGSARSGHQAPGGPRGLRPPRDCSPLTSAGKSHGGRVTAALALPRHLPASPQDHSLLLHPGGVIGPVGDSQMAPCNRTGPFCWGPEVASRPIYIGKWGLCPQFSAVA